MNKNIILLIILLAMLSSTVQAESCAVYITGIGCPNCAVTDPVLLSQYTSEYPDSIIIEYEIYKNRANQEIANKYFETYNPNTRAGIPFIAKDINTILTGRFQVLEANKIFEEENLCPLPNGLSIKFEELDLTKLEGNIKIWTKNRVLISGEGGNNEDLHKLLQTENITSTLEEIEHKKIEPIPVELSDGQIEFPYATEIDGWVLQWNGIQNVESGVTEIKETWQTWYWAAIILAFFILSYLIYRFKIIKKCMCICLTDKQKNYVIIAASILFLIIFFILAKNISPESLERLGYALPLPLFTLFIGLVDGFNPCNLFVLTMLLGLLVSASHSRKKIYIIGYTFIAVVFIIYFIFMAAWLNIFKYIGFITPLRIGIAIIALIAGLINCKELIAFRKGITLMIQDQHKGPLVKRIEHMKDIIKRGSVPALILASISLAAFASLVELPCTAGFPIIYTGILTGKILSSSTTYYLYLLAYNLVYVIPLLVIITIFGYTFEGKQVTKKQMQIIKFIGGLIMILLGLVLLINPELIGIAAI